MTNTALESVASQMSSDGTARPQIEACCLCEAKAFTKQFVFGPGNQVVTCQGCNLEFVNPQPSDAELAEIYSEDYFLGERTDAGKAEVDALKAATARSYLNEIEQYRGKRPGRLLEIGSGPGEFLVEAAKRGFNVTGLEYSESACRYSQARLQANCQPGTWAVKQGELRDDSFERSSFDVCVMSDLIEHIRNPIAFLRIVRSFMKEDGTVFIATPSKHSWSARLMGRHWMEYKTEHLVFFSPVTLKKALEECGFEKVSIRSGKKVLNIRYIGEHFLKYPVPLVTPVFRTLLAILPKALMSKDFEVVASGMNVQATARRL